jgi:UDP:flavonoid glycosyltransferase YjiC (YdhE family)
LLVHHGGIGTTARALDAGVPQVIIPQRFDQPDNAARCERLGVGSVLPPEPATPALVLTMRGLLGKASVATRAAELRRRINSEQGVERLADILEASGSPKGVGSATAPVSSRQRSAWPSLAAVEG